MCIRVDSIKDMPRDLIAKLEKIRPDLEAHDYIDELAEEPHVLRVLAELNAYCISQTVIGIHRTRSFRDSIRKNGLVLQSGQERRDEVLRDYDHLFSEEELAQIHLAYGDYFTPFMNMLRDCRVWFNLCREPPKGAERYWEYYGGEVIYKPLLRLPLICAKLRRIGEPLVVECRLHPGKLRSAWEYPVALVWLSAFHAHVNPRAVQFDVDLYSTEAIPPEDILSTSNPHLKPKAEPTLE